MDIKWKYKIDLKNENVFNEIEKERGISIPNELKDIIISGNAATPEHYRFIVGFTERVLGAVLSFNKDEKNTDTVFTALEVIEDKNLLPFAIDPFGNYICLDLANKEVVFWDHETGNVFGTGNGIKEYFEKLY